MHVSAHLLLTNAGGDGSHQLEHDPVPRLHPALAPESRVPESQPGFVRGASRVWQKHCPGIPSALGQISRMAGKPYACMTG